MSATTLEERFWPKVTKAASCWIWTGARTTSGYGTIRFGRPDRVTYLAHRLSYTWHVGPIPDGLVIDHLCRNRACVNPEHLDPVPQSVNMNRSRRPMCRRGLHAMTDDNITPTSKGSRSCTACIKEKRQRRTIREAEARKAARA
jgi:hypothetical protein